MSKIKREASVASDEAHEASAPSPPPRQSSSSKYRHLNHLNNHNNHNNNNKLKRFSDFSIESLMQSSSSSPSAAAAATHRGPKQARLSPSSSPPPPPTHQLDMSPNSDSESNSCHGVDEHIIVVNHSSPGSSRIHNKHHHHHHHHRSNGAAKQTANQQTGGAESDAMPSPSSSARSTPAPSSSHSSSSSSSSTSSPASASLSPVSGSSTAGEPAGWLPPNFSLPPGVSLPVLPTSASAQLHHHNSNYNLHYQMSPQNNNFNHNHRNNNNNNNNHHHLDVVNGSPPPPQPPLPPTRPPVSGSASSPAPGRSFAPNHSRAPASSPSPSARDADNPYHISRTECTLDNKDMWDKFHALNTEMIITKTGRRMFPVLKVQFHNVNPNALYSVTMDIVPMDTKRYRYAYHKSCWQVAGKADPPAESRLYGHPDSPFKGDLLARQVISFEKVKLTNNEMDKSNHIILNSMHKYQPRVHLVEVEKSCHIAPTSSAGLKLSGSNSFNDPHRNHHHQDHSQYNYNNNNNKSHHHHNHHHHQPADGAGQHQQEMINKGIKTFVFPETVFTAVTAYQNQLITKMKIDKNPFAKGFRDSSRLSDLDRNDPFDYMGSLGPTGRLVGPPGASPGGGGSLPPGGPLELGGPGSGGQFDAYQLLASAATNPWYSAAMAAAASGNSASSNPFNPAALAAAAAMGSLGPPAQVAQHQIQAQQMWLSALNSLITQAAVTSAPASHGPSSAGTNTGPMQHDDK